MLTWYVDTSAALKLLVEEAESTALADAVADVAPRLVGTRLLETELRRAAQRSPGLSQEQVTSLLSSVDLFSITDAVCRHAGLLPGDGLRSLDALHLAASIALGVDAVLTYDHRLIGAAHSVGVPVVSPVGESGTRSPG